MGLSGMRGSAIGDTQIKMMNKRDRQRIFRETQKHLKIAQAEYARLELCDDRGLMYVINKAVEVCDEQREALNKDAYPFSVDRVEWLAVLKEAEERSCGH